MVISLTTPSFGIIVTRDRLAFAGLHLWFIAGLFLIGTPLLFRNMTLQGAFIFASFPFAAGALFIGPRLLMVRRLYAQGRLVEAEILASQDFRRRSQTGTLITYSYEYQGIGYRHIVSTGKPIPGIQPGDRLPALVDPDRPKRSLLVKVFEE
jgi:hypothetical protein